MKNWDDFRHLVAVHKTGSMTKAADLLGTNPATVSRRLARLSSTLGVDLFLKTPGGWSPNVAILDLLDSVTAFENELEKMLNTPLTTGVPLKGAITIGCPPFLAHRVLFTGLGDFQRIAPDISLTFNRTIFQDSLGDNDLFITLARPEQGRLVVSPLGHYKTGYYAYPDSPLDQGWIGLSAIYDQRGTSPSELPKMSAAPRVRLDTFDAVHEVMRSTRLPGILPRLEADADPDLAPCFPDVPASEFTFYLCFHETRRTDAVLQCVVQWVKDRFHGLQEQL
ncbi:LysR family transcriptional regulator [Thalassovita taeanensis]|uniref:DNA-binding transcriptional regulator, LysR family n=1 Tax=Thalassovita taeanensis TaxID=657014 RepID=A0A1H8ZH38_9RHOB|nr:LysR family transcriptional regulator [Thalassovita taeanensis]SEP63671.1 DNA-binding transcriptional regulator, LysR family [Thalassovita taeanensis]